MHNPWFALLDMAIVGIPVAVIGTWQLISINREIARDKAKREADSPESAGHPVRQHRLDDR